MNALGSMDSLMLAAERLGSPMHVGIVLLLAPPAEVDARAYVDAIYRDSVLGTHEVEPRLRRHPYRGPGTRGMWAWRELPELDLSAHVFRETLPPGTGLEALWHRVSELHGERLDVSAPMWTCHVIDGLPEGRFALYIKVHHTVVDGVGGLRMIQDSLSTDPDRRGMPPFYARKEPAETRQGHSSIGDDDQTSRPWRPLAAVRAVAEAAAAGLDLTRRIATAELASVIGSMVSDAVVAPFTAPHTRFNKKLGPQRSATGTVLDRARIRAVQRAADVTANDVITALVGAALRAWLITQDELPEKTLVAMCPVSVRDRAGADATRSSTRADADSGNQFGLGLCPLGTDIADPAERLGLVHNAMSNIKHQVIDKGSDAMLAVMGPAIGSTVALPHLPFGSALPTSSNMAISNVPGPREVMYFNGSRLEAIFPVSTVYDGLGINVTVCSYADRLDVGYVTDPTLVPDIDELVPLTEQALAELEAAVGVTPPTG